MKECQYLPQCGFFNKYNSSNNLACQGFISQYCKGAKMDQCKRLEYRIKNGTPPSHDMLPSGAMMM